MSHYILVNGWELRRRSSKFLLQIYKKLGEFLSFPSVGCCQFIEYYVIYINFFGYFMLRIKLKLYYDLKTIYIF